jgi:hypothetical protein
VFERKALALRQMAEAVRVLNGDAERLLAVTHVRTSPVVVTQPALGTNQYPTDIGPRGRTAVRMIVAERPGEWFVRDIKRINRERGWPTDDSGIETAVFRMAKAGEAVKIRGRKGLYRFGAEAPDEAVTDEGGAATELRLGTDLAA